VLFNEVDSRKYRASFEPHCVKRRRKTASKHRLRLIELTNFGFTDHWRSLLVSASFATAIQSTSN